MWSENDDPLPFSEPPTTSGINDLPLGYYIYIAFVNSVTIFLKLYKISQIKFQRAIISISINQYVPFITNIYQ